MKNKILILITFLIVLVSSCSKDFMKVNEVNPNSASSVAPQLVLPAVQVALAANLNDPNNYEFVNLWYGAYSISSSYSPNAPLIEYNITNTYYQGNWTNLYLCAGNLQSIIDNSKAASERPYKGMARALKAFIFQILVDTYGDIPYSEAFQSAKGILKPKYDNQQAIYEDLVSVCDSAIADLQPSAVAVLPSATQDIMYAGDLTKWRHFANTVKLRILMNQSGMSGRAGYITSNVTNSVGYIGLGEGAMVNPPYLKSANKQSPFFDQWIDPAGNQRDGGLNYYVANQDIIDFLVAKTADPRISYYFDLGATAGGVYVGAYYGQTANLPASGDFATISLTGMIKSFDQPAPILTDMESLFLQAEAAKLGFIPGGDVTAEANYRSAMEASFTYFGDADPATNSAAFIDNADATNNQFASYSNAADKINMLLSEKWATLSTISPMTVWTDYRRSGFPNFLHFSEKAAILGRNNPPVRLFYPQTEISYNPDSEAAAEAANGGTMSLFTTKIFWQNR